MKLCLQTWREINNWLESCLDVVRLQDEFMRDYVVSWLYWFGIWWYHEERLFEQVGRGKCGHGDKMHTYHLWEIHSKFDSVSAFL